MYIPQGKMHRIYYSNLIYMLSDYTVVGRVGRTAELMSGSEDDASALYFYVFRYSGSNSMSDPTILARGWKFRVKMISQRYGFSE